MANERQNRILDQGHALGISAGHPPPVIMAELPGKRGHPSLACCYLFAFKPRPRDGVGKLAICLLVLKILFSPTGPGQPFPADPRAVVTPRSRLCALRKGRSHHRLGGHLSQLGTGSWTSNVCLSNAEHRDAAWGAVCGVSPPAREQGRRCSIFWWDEVAGVQCWKCRTFSI